MTKLPPPDLKVRPEPPLLGGFSLVRPSWMRLLPTGFPENCRSVTKLPPPNLTVERDAAIKSEYQFLRIAGTLGAGDIAGA